MEPADLTPRSKAEDNALESLLRQPLAPLPDHGFTRGVLAMLPAQRPAKSQTRARAIFIAAGALGGLAVVVTRVGSFAAIARDWVPLQAAFTQVAVTLNEPLALVTLMFVAASLFYAFLFSTPRRQ